MRPRVFADVGTSTDVPSVLDCVLDRSLEVTGARLGNVQLVDWSSGCLEIAAQRGFDAEFLNFFGRITLGHGTACGRVLRERSAIVIDDIMTDREFSPYREVAARAGIRAVQSTPLVSSSGALLGVLSTHFGRVHRPTDFQLEALQEAAGLAADAIIRIRANDGNGHLPRSLALLQDSYRAIETAEKLLGRARRATTGRT